MLAPKFDHHRPFTRAQMRRAGLDPELLRTDEYVPVYRGAWVHSDSVDADTRIRAALLIHPKGAFATRFSAARVWRLPVPDHRFEHVTVRKREDRRFRPGIKPHVTTRPRRVTSVRGIPVSDLIATFIDLAGSLGLVDLVVLGDAMVRKYDVTPRRLVRACQDSDDYYAKAALHAASYVRDGVDSPMETRLRMLIVLAGLPEPVVNLEVCDEQGAILRRYDLAYPELKLIIEYDGWQHAADRRQWEGDLDRREELDDQGQRILVVTSPGLRQDAERTLERIRRQLVERGMPNVPEIGDEWRAHFA